MKPCSKPAGTTTWYKFGWYGVETYRVEVVKITEKSVQYWDPFWNSVRRSMSRSDFFPTWEAARNERIRRAGQSVARAEESLEFAKKKLEEALAVPFKEPLNEQS
jgi:hypothetical protein